MLKKLSEWFASQIEQDKSEQASHTVELATAVLMHEIMSADGKMQDAEQASFLTRLNGLYSLSEDELNTLKALSKTQAEHAADFVQFTRVINQHCLPKQKRQILDSLWHVAYSDGQLDPHEEHLIRRISDLMHMPHSQFIKSKLSVQPNS